MFNQKFLFDVTNFLSESYIYTRKLFYTRRGSNNEINDNWTMIIEIVQDTKIENWVRSKRFKFQSHQRTVNLGVFLCL